jgi:hypothetical protein
METYSEALKLAGEGEILVPIVVWPNRDREGLYLSLELSPLLGQTEPPVTIEKFLGEWKFDEVPCYLV